jgi:hypothetical protein
MYREHACLTRIVGNSFDVPMTSVQDITQRIETALEQVPIAYRHYIASELLDYALSYAASYANSLTDSYTRSRLPK